MFDFLLYKVLCVDEVWTRSFVAFGDDPVGDL